MRPPARAMWHCRDGPAVLEGASGQGDHDEGAEASVASRVAAGGLAATIVRVRG